MTRQVVILAGAIGICAASSAQAHHSHGWIYDLCKSTTIEGRVDSVLWKNPHTWVGLALDDATMYQVEWTSAMGLSNQGLADAAKASLVVGERVVVTGHPIKDPAVVRANYPSFKDDLDPKIIDPTQIRRADNSWTWALPSGPVDSHCPVK